MRVATRRLRSALRTFAPILTLPDDVDLSEELAWLADELGRFRDAEVLRDHLLAEVHDIDSIDVPSINQAETFLNAHLFTRMDDGRAGAIAALRSDRYIQLLDDLVGLAFDPPVPTLGPCTLVLPGLVWQPWRALVKAMRELDPDAPAEQWHRVRIRAKRARYAAEAVVPIFGGSLQRMASKLAELTDALGTGQDAHVARECLLGLIKKPDMTIETAFALGHLHEREITRELSARTRALDAWPSTRRAAKRSRLGERI
jgi:CHAD domain-containing protein